MGQGGPETKYCAVFKPKYIFPHEMNVICFRQISGHKDRKRHKEICICGHVTPNDLFDYIVRPPLVSIAFFSLVKYHPFTVVLIPAATSDWPG